MLTHDTKSVIMELKALGGSIRIEGCLHACGDCREAPFCLMNNDRVTFTSLADLEKKAAERVL